MSLRLILQMLQAGICYTRISVNTTRTKPEDPKGAFGCLRSSTQNSKFWINTMRLDNLRATQGTTYKDDALHLVDPKQVQEEVKSYKALANAFKPRQSNSYQKDAKFYSDKRSSQRDSTPRDNLNAAVKERWCYRQYPTLPKGFVVSSIRRYGRIASREAAVFPARLRTRRLTQLLNPSLKTCSWTDLVKAATVVKSSSTTRRRKVAPIPKAPVAQSAPPVPHPFELESPGAGPSESISEARARRAAEKAQHEKAVCAARLEKCKKKEAVKHCISSSWAADLNCGKLTDTAREELEWWCTSLQEWNGQCFLPSWIHLKYIMELVGKEIK
ncbi:hypothetical protein BGZ72_000197 [Mortierella alpina]|nr:hypothetical protein BGZ72_000197 [Mortierella alpina]